MQKKSAGEILLEHNLISKPYWDEAVRNFQKTGKSAIVYVAEKGYISETDIAHCLSEKFGFPYVDMQDCDVSPEVVALIPAEISKKFILLPVDRGGDMITVVMADPFDSEAVSAIEQSSGLKVQQFVGLISDIQNGIRKLYDNEAGSVKLSGKKCVPSMPPPSSGVAQVTPFDENLAAKLSESINVLRSCRGEMEHEIKTFEEKVDKLIKGLESTNSGNG